MRHVDSHTRIDTVEVRALEQLTELRAVDALFESVWGVGIPTLGAEFLRSLSHEGGYVTGAFLRGQLVGASVGFRGIHHNRLSLHSHVTGVSPQARGAHVGTALKLPQRDWALAHGIEVVTWTFDPLVRRKAWFNIGRLGARPVEYLVNFYGSMRDSINAGDESDRLLMAWDVSSPLPTVVLDGEQHRVIPTPEDIESLRGTDPVAARHWRARLRAELSGPVADGQVVGFTREGGYVLRD